MTKSFAASKFRLGAKKFIIIIEDVTSVKTTILEDLSQILKTHLEEMDTCLVFGMFTAFSIFNYSRFGPILVYYDIMSFLTITINKFLKLY